MKRNHNTTSVVVPALCNQPDAFALDLGDDQSHCLFTDKKSDMDFQLVSKSVTFDCPMFVITCYFTQNRANYMKFVAARPILSAKNVVQ